MRKKIMICTYLEPAQVLGLDALAKVRECSKAELIREAVEKLLRRAR